MKKHLTAWFVAAAFVWSGLALVACEDDALKPPRTQCVERTETGVKAC